MGRIFRRAGAVFGVAIVALLLYGGLIEPRLILDVRRYEVAVPGLADPWSGAEIAVLSDLQIGMWLANTGMVERAVDEVVEAEPTAVLLAGDFVYHTDAAVDELMELLAPLTETDLPAFAVLGNHDHASGGAEDLNAALEGQGIDVLRNEAAALPSGDRTGAAPHLYVAGVGSARFGRSDPVKALRGIPDGAPRVVLMHNPSSFPGLPPDSAPLAVAGHTHCGQVALPGTPAWSYLELVQDERVAVGGFAPEGYGAAGNRLFVTCGIGFSLVPIRINAAPQVAFFRLVAPGAPDEPPKRGP